jgi:hypothetical protein
VKRSGLKLKILDGQHRYAVAEKLALPIAYVETEREDWDISLCGSAQTPWKLSDHVTRAAAQNKPGYIDLMRFLSETKLPLIQAASLLAGDHPPGGSVKAYLKSGLFEVKDMAHARRVAGLVNALRAKAKWALQSNCVSALSRFLRLPDFDEELFMKKVEAHSERLIVCGDIDAYGDMFERVYNFASRNPKPLAFEAREAHKRRLRRAGKSTQA